MNRDYQILLFLTIFASLVTSIWGVTGNAIALGLGFWLISTKNIKYIPLLIIITSFLSTSYVLYIYMLFVTIRSYNNLSIKGLGRLFFVFSLMVITVLFFAFVKLQTTDVNIGTSLKDYIFILALSPFFFGAAIFTKKADYDVDWDRIFESLIIIGILNVLIPFINPSFVQSRLVFLIIPFLFTYIFINFFDLSQIKKVLSSGLLLLYYLGSGGTTFTLVFSAFISIVIIRGKFKSAIIPFLLFLVVFYVPIYAINYSETLDFTEFTDLGMSDIKTLDDFNGRLGMKLIEDRGPIWTSAWDYLKENFSILPPIDKYKLFIKSKMHSETEWEFHSHNLVLESFLNLGLILGFLVLIYFFYINFNSIKGFNDKSLKPIAKLFIIVSVVSNIVGSMSGIFPLLTDYSFLPFFIMGAYYYNKKDLIL